MKIEQLLEEPKTGYNKERKALVGHAVNWLEDAGISRDDVDAVIPKIKSSPEFKKILDLGFNDTTGSIQRKKGTFEFTSGPEATAKIGRYSFDARGRQQRSPEPVMYTIYANGQLRYTTPNKYQTRLASPKPALVHGNPQASLIKIYTRALTQLHDFIVKVFKKEHPDQRLATRLKINLDELERLKNGDKKIQQRVISNIYKTATKSAWDAENMLAALERNHVKLPQEAELKRDVSVYSIAQYLTIKPEVVKKLLTGDVKSQAEFLDHAHRVRSEYVIKHAKQHFKFDPTIEKELDELLKLINVEQIARTVKMNVSVLLQAVHGDKRAKTDFLRALLQHVKDSRGEFSQAKSIIAQVRKLGIDLPEFKTIEKSLNPK